MSTSGSDKISPKLDEGLKGGGVDDRAESVGPPLAPADMPVAEHGLRESAEGSPDSFSEATATEQHPVAAPALDHASATEEAARPKGKLIAGIAVVGALALAVLAYFFVPFRGEKTVTPARTEQPAATVRPEPVAPAPSAALPQPQPPPAGRAEPTPGAPSSSTSVQAPPAVPAERTAPSSEAPPPVRPAQPPTPPAEAPAQIAPAPVAPAPVAPTPPATNDAALRPPAPVPQGRQILFLQRPGVNIRSNPSTAANVVGSAPRGTRFEVTNRSGEWVQVESGRFNGWISARFLGPNPP
jgi:hypothetical protein